MAVLWSGVALVAYCSSFSSFTWSWEGEEFNSSLKKAPQTCCRGRQQLTESAALGRV
jgi:hypothetical protein